MTQQKHQRALRQTAVTINILQPIKLTNLHYSHHYRNQSKSKESKITCLVIRFIKCLKKWMKNPELWSKRLNGVVGDYGESQEALNGLSWGGCQQSSNLSQYTSSQLKCQTMSITPTDCKIQVSIEGGLKSALWLCDHNLTVQQYQKQSWSRIHWRTQSFPKTAVGLLRFSPFTDWAKLNSPLHFPKQNRSSERGDCVMCQSAVNCITYHAWCPSPL